jgi:hypothetical protein
MTSSDTTAAGMPCLLQCTGCCCWDTLQVERECFVPHTRPTRAHVPSSHARCQLLPVKSVLRYAAGQILPLSVLLVSQIGDGPPYLIIRSDRHPHRAVTTAYRAASSVTGDTGWQVLLAAMHVQRDQR